MDTTGIVPTDVYDRQKVEELVEKLNSVSWGRTGFAAYLVETPEPHRHVLREHVEVEPGRGFAGDHDRKSFYRAELVPGREVSAISLEVLRTFGVRPEVPGDNLITEGIDLTKLREGDRMQVGDILLERSNREHRPCMTFRARTSPEAYAAAARTRHRGALFVVVRGGILHQGDPIELI